MNLMLVATLAWVAVGLVAPRFGRREQMIAYAIAAVMVGLYYLFPARYM